MIVDQEQNFEFTFMSNTPYYRVSAGDCIQLKFHNPYEIDSPATYQSFEQAPGTLSQCKVSEINMSAHCVIHKVHNES